MQSIASLMSIGRVSDIGNIDDIDEELDLETSKETTAKINELASQFGLFDMGDGPEADDDTNPFSSKQQSGTSTNWALASSRLLLNSLVLRQISLFSK